MVKESGYAGFLIPIDVYLKNHTHIPIVHDLVLDIHSPLKKVTVERHTVVCTADDFRKKLIRGGGVCTLHNIIVE